MKYFLFFSSFFLVTIVYSQEIKEFKGKSYIKKDDIWYTSDRYTVNNEIITIKYKEKDSSVNFDLYGSPLRVNSLGFIDLRVPNGISVFEFAELIDKNPKIESIDINTIGSYTYIPDDIRFSQQWYLDQIQMEDAWNFNVGNNTVIVAIIDSGIDFNHEDIGLGNDQYQNIWLNNGEDPWSDPSNPSTGNGIDDDGNGFIDDWKAWNFPMNSNNNLPTIPHGTHVAGIISAKTNNSVGIAGIAGGNGTEGVKMMNLIAGMTDPDASLLDDNILYAIEQGANVIQLSLSVSHTTAIDAAIQSAINNNITVICASGNDNGPLTYPAN